MFYNPAASPAPLHHAHHVTHKLFQPDSLSSANGNPSTASGNANGGGSWRPPGLSGNGGGYPGHSQQPSFGSGGNSAFGNVGHGGAGGGGQAGQGYNLLAGLQGPSAFGGGGNNGQGFISGFGGGSGLTPGGGHHGQHTPHGLVGQGQHQAQLMQQGQGMPGQGHGGGGQAVGGGPGQQQHVQQGQQGLLQALNGNSPPGMRVGVGHGMGVGVSMMGQVQQEVGGPYWEQQIIRAQASRSHASPHSRAKASAVASRSTTTTTSKALPILDPNRPIMQIANTPSLLHRKAGANGITITEDDRMTDNSSPGLKPAHPTSLSTPATAADQQEPELFMGLDLGGIKLRTLSPALFGFSHVTALYINHNQLTSLSPAISQMRALAHLDVTGNLLTSIPPELGLLVHLKELLLFDNQLQDLPLELGTLYQLEFLGIEGNPLSDSIRHAMAERGTQGLIAYFRDNCPAPPPPPPRKWEVIQEIENEGVDDATGGGRALGGLVDEDGDDQKDTFSILSFNILCERYATHTMYGYTPQWALNWEHRKDEILKQILESGAHIVCLQEVDDEQYHDFFLPNLEQRGFDGAFNPKTRARTMSTDERKRVDGCATFWKTSKYALIERQVIEFNQVALGKAEMRTEDMFNRVMSKDNISVACLLESTTTDSRLVVANAHIHWDPLYRDVKLVQVAMLIEEIEKLREQFARFPPKPPKDGEKRPFSRYQDPSHIPALICGDFNSIPHTAVYEFLSEGTVAADHEDFMTHQYGHYTNRGLYHKMGLKSAYAHIGELPLTNYTPGYEGAIDYIWYTTSTLAVTELLGEVDKQYLSRVVGFPNAHFPSDHIPICAKFMFKQPPKDSTNHYRR